MALYLGSSEKQKIRLSNGGVFNLNLYTLSPITNGIRLLTSDNYILKDSKGIYITTKEVK